MRFVVPEYADGNGFVSDIHGCYKHSRQFKRVLILIEFIAIVSHIKQMKFQPVASSKK